MALARSERCQAEYCRYCVVAGAISSLHGNSDLRLPFAALPYGTCAVNIIGCLAGLTDFRQLLGPSQRVFLMIGVLGGFTTFSTFAYETFELAQYRELARAFANVAAQVVVGFGAAALGYVGAIRVRTAQPRPCGDIRSCSGPSGTMPVGLMSLWVA